MNREPIHERASDSDLVAIEIAAAREEDRPISDAAARVIASQWHGGQNSELYAFASTGCVGDGLLAEINTTFPEATNDIDRLALANLYVYIHEREDNAAVDGWSQLWLGKGPDEETENCAACGEHLSDPHAGECPLNPDYLEKLEQQSLEERIKEALQAVTTSRLIQRMEHASDDANLDDETYELSRRLQEEGKTWKWTQSFTNPQIVIADLPEGEYPN